MLGFGIWALFGLFCIGLGIYSSSASKAVGFWANFKDTAKDISDVKSYNKAAGKLWVIFGLIFILLGLPLLGGQNSSMIFISILGVFLEIIIFMVAIIKLEIKYKNG